MVYFFKMISKLFLELIFDSKEEYNIRSEKFNARKSFIFIFILASMVLIWVTFGALVRVNNSFLRYKAVASYYCARGEMPATFCGKTPPTIPSNEGDPPIRPKNVLLRRENPQ